MAYRIDPDQPFAEQCRRIAAEQLDKAVAELDQMQGEPQEAARRVRARLKKLRGLLVLLRQADKAFYAEENARYRDLARRLGGLRDAASNLEILDNLAELAEDSGAAQLREALARASAAAIEHQASPAIVRLGIEQGRATLGALQLDPQSAVKAIARGFGDNYAKAKRSLELAAATGAARHFHALRKRLKYHWMHLKLLRGAWPAEIAPMQAASKAAADALGLHHDIVVLLQAIERLPAEAGDQTRLQALLAARAEAQAGHCVAAARPLLERRRKAWVADIEQLFRRH